MDQDDLKDCIAVKNQVAEVCKGPIGIMGSGYGGFMALTAMANHSGEFAVASHIDDFRRVTADVGESFFNAVRIDRRPFVGSGFARVCFVNHLGKENPITRS